MSVGRRSFLALGAAALVGCARAGARDARAGSAPRVPVGCGWVSVVVRRGAPDEIDHAGALAPDALVEVASLSKPVFAFAVASEAARGALDLDAPIARIAPPPYRHVRRNGEDAFDDPRLAQVTPRILLAHRSGLPNWSRTEPLAFVDAPGAGFHYSGEGYALLQRVLEAARGEALEALARRAVLQPLGMARSTYDPKAAPARAAGHDRAGAIVPSSVDAPLAPTSLLSTASDYARFVRHLVEAPDADPVVATMLARQVEVDPDRRLAWGTGIALAEPEHFFHWGVNPGFRALFVGSRRRGEAVLVLTDWEGGMEVAADLVRARLGDLPLLSFPMLYPDD